MRAGRVPTRRGLGLLFTAALGLPARGIRHLVASLLALFAVSLVAAPLVAAPRPAVEDSAARAPPAVSAVPAAPLPLAMLLPPVGTSSEPTRADFDSALRAAIDGLGTYRLQPAEETRKHILSLAELGLICVPDDTPCLVKLGLAAEADLVLVPVVDADPAVPGNTRATLIAVLVETGTVGATAKASGVFTAAAPLRPLLDEALGIAPDRHPAPAAPSAPSPGVLLTVAGAAATGVALVSALTAELAYAHLLPADANTRADIARPIGIAAWVVTLIGGAALTTGIVLLGTASPAPELAAAAAEAP